MTACSSLTKPDFKVDRSLLIRCPPIPLLSPANGDKLSMGELAEADIELSGMYSECKRRMDGNIDAIEAYMGKKDAR